MAQVCALSLLFWRDLCRSFTGRNGITPHRVLKPWCGEDESQADWFGANVLQTYPGIRRNKHQSSRLKIAILIAEPDVGLSALNQHDFILDQVPVLR